MSSVVAASVSVSAFVGFLSYFDSLSSRVCYVQFCFPRLISWILFSCVPQASPLCSYLMCIFKFLVCFSWLFHYAWFYEGVCFLFSGGFCLPGSVSCWITWEFFIRDQPTIKVCFQFYSEVPYPASLGPKPACPAPPLSTHVSLKRFRWAAYKWSLYAPSSASGHPLQYSICHLLPTAENPAAETTAAAHEAWKYQDINTPLILLGGEPVSLPSSAS